MTISNNRTHHIRGRKQGHEQILEADYSRPGYDMEGDEMKLENIRRSITIEGYKFTPKAIKSCHLVYIGTAEECEAYAEKLDRENNTDCAFVGCLGDFDIKSTGLVFRGPWATIKALENVHFVEYWA